MDPTQEFLCRQFSRYYKENRLHPVPDATGREWAAIYLSGGFMKRHMAFNALEDLEAHCRSGTLGPPAHLYHSAAHYKDPGARKMVDKGWKGADLIFDLDADHLKDADKMSYAEQLREVKRELAKLMDEFILGDLGFAEEDISIVFSGGRGYHIHVYHPSVQKLNSHQRREVVDYITGNGLDLDRYFRQVPVAEPHIKGIFAKPLSITRTPGAQSGWGRRLMQGSAELIMDWNDMAKEDVLKYLIDIRRIGKKKAAGLYAQLFEARDADEIFAILTDSEKVTSRDNLFQKLSDDGRRTLLQVVKERVAVSLEGETDEPVTTDIKRLIRMPLSIHGKTGFRVVPLSREAFDAFDPLMDAVVFSDDPVKVQMQKDTDIALKGERYELTCDDGVQEVPCHVAVFLFGRKAATLAQ